MNPVSNSDIMLLERMIVNNITTMDLFFKNQKHPLLQKIQLVQKKSILDKIHILQVSHENTTLTILQKCQQLLVENSDTRIDIIKQYNNVVQTVHSEKIPMEELLAKI